MSTDQQTDVSEYGPGFPSVMSTRAQNSSDAGSSGCKPSRGFTVIIRKQFDQGDPLHRELKADVESGSYNVCTFQGKEGIAITMTNAERDEVASRLRA